MSYGTVTLQLCSDLLTRQRSEFNSIALAEAPAKNTALGKGSVGVNFNLGVPVSDSLLKTYFDVSSHPEIRTVNLLLSLVSTVFFPWGACPLSIREGTPSR